LGAVNSEFLILGQPREAAIERATRQFTAAYLQAVRTFDLQVARQDNAGCFCPHHGPSECDCQIGVLLVYDEDRQPITLIGYGINAPTWLSIVDIHSNMPIPS